VAYFFGPPCIAIAGRKESQDVTVGNTEVCDSLFAVNNIALFFFVKDHTLFSHQKTGRGWRTTAANWLVRSVVESATPVVWMWGPLNLCKLRTFIMLSAQVK